MPLLKGSKPNIISANIKELRHAGYPENQAVAIALKKANKGSGKAIAKKVAKHDTSLPFGKR